MPTGNAGYVVAGYVLTAAALAGYLARLLVRARRARERVKEITARR